MENALFGTLTRRDFTKLAAASAALVGLGGTAAQALADEDGDDGTTIVYALNEDPQALDPALVNDFGSLELCANLYEGLFRFVGETVEVEPCLAESYEVSDDGLTYVFHLREGVKFHDGTDFNADAVVTNFERQMDGNALENMGYAEFVFGSEESGVGVKTVEATDEHTVTVVLRAACTPFLRNLAMALGSPIVSPTALEAAGGDMSKSPCGTGPYKLREWNPGENITLEAFDDYWDTDNAPKVKTVVFRVLPESSTRVVALANSEVDIITAVDASSAPVVEGNGDTVVAIDGLNVNALTFNTTGTLSDVEVRRAICQAINVDELTEALYGDYAQPAVSFMPLFMAPYAEQVEYPAYDPDAARETLSAAGINDLIILTYTTAMQYNPAGGSALAEAIQGYLSEVGVNATVNAYDWVTFRTKRYEEYFDLALTGWAGDNGDPDNFMNLLAGSGSYVQMTGYHSDEYNELVAQGIQTPDGDERDAIYLRLEQLVAQDLPCRPLSHASTVCAYKPWISNFSMHSTGWSKLAGVEKSE